MEHPVFCKYRHGLSAVESLKELEDLCKHFFSDMGYNLFLFWSSETTSLLAPKVSTFTNFPQAFLDFYYSRIELISNELSRICFESYPPISWDGSHDKILFDLNLNEKGIENSVFEYGGDLFPLSSGKNALGVVLLARNSGTTTMATDVSLPMVSLFCDRMLDAFIRIDKHLNPRANDLTSRELECVFWACEGKTAWEISKILGISERTVNFHLTSVIKKLGASNRQHAVAKAVMYGLVRPRF